MNDKDLDVLADIIRWANDEITLQEIYDKHIGGKQ